MAAEKKLSCSDCKHYTDKLGSNGYCKLYRHDLAIPEVVCSRFEQGTSSVEELTESNPLFGVKLSRFEIPDGVRKVMLIAGSISCVILMIIGILFGSVLEGVVTIYKDVPFLWKAAIDVAVAAIILLICVGLFALVRKFPIVSILVFLTAVFVVLVIFLKFDEIWLGFNGLVTEFYENVLHFK